jgi:3-oxoacyl-[acyl-carrier protein] reductase
MRNLAAEYADRGITVNGVSPDMVETKFLDDIPDLVIKQNAEKSPLKRNLTPKDVIPAIKYLLSDEAEAVTGTNMGITGGYVSW